MIRPRVSIAGMMAVVLVSALGVKALLSPTPLWASGIFTLTLMGLALALPGLPYRTGSKRAFWLGYAVFGWGYWVLSLSPWVGEAIQPRLVTTEVLKGLNDQIRPSPPIPALERLVEEAILASPQAIQLTQSLFASEDKLNEVRRRTRNNSDPTLKKAVDEHQALVAQYDQLWQTMYPNIKARISATWSPTATPLVVAHDPEPFQRIGHSLFALLSALLGGMIAVRFHHTRDTTPCPSDDNSPTNRSTT